MSDHERRTDWTIFAAVALIALGVWFLLGNVFGTAWQQALRNAIRLAWPIALITLGVLLYAASSKRDSASQQAGRRLYRSRSDRMLSGVLAGVASYLGTDPTLVRILYVVFGVLTGAWPAFIVYVIASIVIPEEPAGGASPAAAGAPQWPGKPAEPPQAPPSAEGWPQGWPHTGTETVQTPPPPPSPPAEDADSAPADDPSRG